jgi:hypothetical protein
LKVWAASFFRMLSPPLGDNLFRLDYVNRATAACPASPLASKCTVLPRRTRAVLRQTTSRAALEVIDIKIEDFEAGGHATNLKEAPLAGKTI